jgi:predicted transcriptional regulator
MDLKSKNIGVRVPHDIAQRLEAIASSERRTLSQVCRNLIVEGLERQDNGLDAIMAQAMKRTRTSTPAQAIRALLALGG